MFLALLFRTNESLKDVISECRDVLLVEELNRGGSARIFVGKWRCQVHLLEILF